MRFKLFFSVLVLGLVWPTSGLQAVTDPSLLLKPGWPVFAPNSTTMWQTGQAVQVEWDADQVKDTLVNISLHNAECLSSVCVALAPLSVAEGVVNTGKVEWSIPTNLNNFYLGKQYLRISGKSNSASSITSQNFILKESQSTTSFVFPGSGGVLQVGNQYTIAWKGDQATKGETLQLAPYYACLYTVPACALAEPKPEVLATGLTGKVEYTWQTTEQNFQGQLRLTLLSGEKAVLATSPVFSLVKEQLPVSTLQLKGQEKIRVNRGESLRVEYVVSGGTPPYTWQVEGSLPEDLTLQPVQIQCVTVPCVSPADIAVLSGTGSKLGRFDVKFLVRDASGLSGTLNVKLTVLPDKITDEGLSAGQLIRTPDKAVRLILDNFEYYEFTSMQDLADKGYRRFQIKPVASADFSKYQSHAFYRPSGTTFRYAGEKTVYYLTKDYCKQAYTSYKLFTAWLVQLIDIVLLQAGEVFPACEEGFVRLPDLKAVKGRGKTVYIHEAGELRPVTSAAAFRELGYNFSEVLTVEEADLARYQRGLEVK